MNFSYSEKDLELLSDRDPVMGEYIRKKGKIERSVNEDVFYSVVDSIAGQQISSAALETVRRKLLEISGGVTPERISALSAEELKTCGMSLKKAENIKAFAESVCSGKTDLKSFGEKDDEEIIEELTAFRGIGRWTAEMTLIFSLQRKDVLSFGDFGIRKGLCMLYGYEKISRELFEKFRKRFSPCCTVASFYLWEAAREPEPLNKEDFAVIKTPAGLLEIKGDNRGIESVLWTEEKEKPGVNPVVRKAAEELEEYFEGKRKVFDVPLNTAGTDFQKRVWEETAKIPFGKTKTYGEIASLIGSPRGARAVGGAVNRNPVNIIVPCHRVLGADSSLTGYRGGIERKRFLLEIEGALKASGGIAEKAQ